MFVIKYRKIFYGISTVLILAAIILTSVWGINFGIDFTGGSILEVDLGSKFDKGLIQENLNSVNSEKSFSIRETGESGYILKSKTITDEEKNKILESLNTLSDNSVEEIRFNTIGPTLGSELRSKATVAIAVVVLAIILFVAYAFRKVSKPVSSWKYGLVAIIAFIHDVLIPIGLFSVLGYSIGVEVDTLFVIAILVVLGYSINDTIVVFDRIRENLGKVSEKNREEKFEEVVGKSLRQTVGRSINTSFTTLVVLLALFFIGGEATKWFALALVAGVIAGTYSSIFFAAPMLVTFSKLGKNK